jgi:diaminohydroxyphosphoribosylaminopyrimidine deaminase/5-amino-6-(5-phosphoribosylamino)uracil reductase
MTQNDAAYMKLALRLAARGAGWVSPNPMVGAVVVRDGQIIGKGYHRRVGAPHAEVEALRRAGASAKGADLYVTLEPCNHQGRTPPCTKVILKAGVGRVVIATRDPNPRVAGDGAGFLAARGVAVEVGLLEAEARRLNEAFFKAVTTGLPLVIAKAACSLDGKIATATGESQWLTAEPTRTFAHRLRHQVDAILVGIGTVLADDPRLTTRLPHSKDPIRLILDSRLRLPLTARVINPVSPAPTWVACRDQAPKEKVRALQQLGVEVLIMPEEAGLIALRPLLEFLGQRQIQSLLVEGGAETLGSFFDQGLVDKFYFFYAPKFLGGWNALGVLGGQGVAHLRDAPLARDLTIRRLGTDIMISGYL